MKLNARSLVLALTLLAGGFTPALAADWNYGAGSMKDFGSTAVPVMAPVPVPIYEPQWYFRMDAGIGFGDKPEADETGLIFGQDSLTGSFEAPAAWLNNDFETFVTLGIGVGKYWSDTFRTDFTAETRSQGKVKINGEYAYTSIVVAGAQENVSGIVKDETTLRGGVILFNGYYDFHRFNGSNFRPYVGGGVGFAWNELKRNHSTTELTCDAIADPACVPNLARDSINVQDKTHSVTFAAAATTGFAYKISQGTHFDMNYRFLYIGGTDQGFGVSGGQFGGDSKVSIGDTYEHQIRAGLRFDVN